MVKLLPRKEQKSRIKDKLCPYCSMFTKKYYNSSSLGRHLRTVHGPKYHCQFCDRKYTDKNSHKFCLEKEKYFLQSFIFNLNKPINNESLTDRLFLSSSFFAMFDDFKTCLVCRKLKLGNGHYSEVYYGLDKFSFAEIAVKLPRKLDYLDSYQKEGIILKILDEDGFYPKVYNFDENSKIEKLELSLMGPSLYDFFKFSDGFDELTIINIFENLLLKLRFMSTNNIIHHDVKPENIVCGIFEKSKLINTDELYFIDYGLSLNFNDDKLSATINNNWRKGTLNYMSINTHKNKRPNISDDIESLIYSCIYLAGIELPWKHLDVSGFVKNDEILKLKTNFDICKFCGEKLEFISQIFIYLNIIREGKKKLDFDVIFEFIALAKKKIKKKNLIKKSKYIFLDELKIKLMEFKLSGKTIPEDLKLKNLFSSYPLDLNKLYDSLN
jgi:serine/threonine protein kinase